MTQLRAGSATDVGLVRKNNEDDLLVADPVFAVADGMGGHAAGEVASHTAIDALERSFGEDDRTVEGLIRAVQEANRAVYSSANDHPELRGMGTTLTVVALVVEDGEDHVAIANVGDSRVYLLRDGELGMLTDDHSVAEQLVREGRLTPEEAAVHPQRHVLTRVLGMAPEVDVDCYPILPYEGDRYLLCSDGLVNEVSESQIASLLRRLADPAEAARELVAMAKESGGHDNITVVVVDVVDDGDRAHVASAALAGEDATAHAADGDGAAAAAAAVSTTGTGDDVDVDNGGTALADASAAGPGVLEAPAAADDADRRTRRQRRKDARVGPRRITFRVVLFLLLLVLVLGAAGAAVGWYARGTYYVGVQNGEVVIFKGRAGGLLWFDPTVARRTGMAEADVPPVSSGDVHDGKQEPTLAAAERYVRNLQDEHRNLVAASGGSGAPTTTVPVAPTATAPSAATTVAP